MSTDDDKQQAAIKSSTCHHSIYCLLALMAALIVTGVAFALLFTFVLQQPNNNEKTEELALICHSPPLNSKCKPFKKDEKTFPINVPNEKEIADSGHILGIIPLQYNLNLTFDYNGGKKIPFCGKVTIHLKIVKATSWIVLDLEHSALTMLTVQLTENCSKMICISRVISNRHTGQVLIKVKRTLVPENNYQLTIVFKGLKTSDGGIFSATNHKTEWAIGTLFQMRYARKVFPSMDHPALKANFELCLTHRLEVEALSNTKEKSIKKAENNMTETCFRKTPKMPTYVFTFTLAKGYTNLIKRSNDTSTFPDLVSISALSEGGNKFSWILNEAQRITERLIDITQTEYSMKRLAFININPSPFWGIENYGLITLDAGWTSFPEYDNAHQILVHEIIHQWLGNYFTVNYWDEICLQEGLTAYMEWRISTALNLVKSTLAIKVEEARYASFGGERFGEIIIQPFNKTQQIADNCFKKPPMIFHMIEHAFGNGTVNKFLAHMSKNYKFANAGLKQWSEGFSKVTETDGAGKMLENWFTKTGFPLLLIQNANETIQITGRTVVKNVNITDSYFLPLKVDILYSNGNTEGKFMANDSLSFTDPKADWFLLDPHVSTLSHSLYPVQNYRSLLECYERKLNNGSDCKLRNEQIHAVFKDFCWGLLQDQFPLKTDKFQKNTWEYVFNKLREMTSMKRSINLGRGSCRCCFKNETELQNDDAGPWSPWACKRNWIDSCQPLKIMNLLDRNYNITIPKSPWG